jgi:hypothetical protein
VVTTQFRQVKTNGDLRASGCIVIKQLSGQHADQPACNQKLEKIDENWVLVPLN